MPVRCTKKVCRFCITLCRIVYNFVDIGKLKAKDLHVHLWTLSQKKKRPFTIQHLVLYSRILTHQTLTLQPKRACKAIFGQARIPGAPVDCVVQHHQLSLRFSTACLSKEAVVTTRIKGRTTLRESVRIEAGLRRKTVLAEERSSGEEPERSSCQLAARPPPFAQFVP